MRQDESSPQSFLNMEEINIGHSPVFNQYRLKSIVYEERLSMLLCSYQRVQLSFPTSDHVHCD